MPRLDELPFDPRIGHVSHGLANKTTKESKKQLRYNCAENEKNYAANIWTDSTVEGHKGEPACVVVPWFADRFAADASWRPLAYWIHDHLPYSEMEFFKKLCAFNLSWHERPKKRILVTSRPRGSRG